METTLKGLGNAVITTEHESNTEKAETKTETRDDVSYEPLFRDSSFLGFPAVYMVIPGFRSIRKLDGSAVRLKRTIDRAGKSFASFPHLGDEEAKRILRLIRYYEHDPGFKVFSLFSNVPAGEYSDAALGAVLSLQLKDFESACHFLRTAIWETEDREKRKVLVCLSSWSELCAEGMDMDEARRVVSQLYAKETAEKVCMLTEDLSKMMEKWFEPIPCPGCESCRFREGKCQIPEENALALKVMKAMKKDNVSQEHLLNLLKELWPK
ncbi:MAG: hypothetical protein IKD66_07285 [Solobacterium sp.]|nr:hypothetical protein [Solobacterium sp.]